MTITDEEIRPIAEYLFRYRTEHNLKGDDIEDWNLAYRILISLKTESMLREAGRVTARYR